MVGVNGQARGGVLSPAELAASMRDGFEARRVHRVPRLPDLPAVPDNDPAAALWPLSGLVGHPAPARPGLKGAVLRSARRVVKKLMGPWLDHQTRFNHTLTATVQAQSAEVLHQLRMLNRRSNEVTAGFPAAVQALERRVNEFFHELTTLRASNTVADSTTHAAAEEVFLQTRMPEPPGLALILSAGRAVPPVVPAAGYAVMVAPPDAAVLPLTDHSIRLAVALDRDGWNAAAVWGDDPAPRVTLARVLSHGGRVVGSLRSDGAVSTDEDVARACAPLRVLEIARTAGLTVWVAGV